MKSSSRTNVYHVRLEWIVEILQIHLFVQMELIQKKFQSAVEIVKKEISVFRAWWTNVHRVLTVKTQGWMNRPHVRLENIVKEVYTKMIVLIKNTPKLVGQSAKAVLRHISVMEVLNKIARKDSFQNFRKFLKY